MEFLQHLSNPYAVIGLIVFVAAGALGLKANAASQSSKRRSAGLFFGLALVSLATTAGVAWMDMKKAETDRTDTIHAKDGSKVISDVEATDSGTINIDQ